MSTQTPDADQPSPAELQEQLEAYEQRLDELEAMVDDQDGMPKMVIIAVHGTLDMAYPTLILGGLAAQMGWDVTVFATFWALDMLHEDKSDDLKMSSVGNPHMPVPNLVGALPGMDRMTTWMMRRKMDEMDVETVGELIDRAMEAGVDFQACEMTAELMDYDEDDFIEGVTTGVGAAGALMDMGDAEVQLVI